MNGRHPDVVGAAVIDEHAVGLAGIAGQVPLDTAVATCPGWTMADLVWHLTEVELFSAHVIGHRPAGPESYEEPTRPADPVLIDGLERAATSLVDALPGVDPGEPAWSWSDDQNGRVHPATAVARGGTTTAPEPARRDQARRQTQDSAYRSARRARL